ncbi:MAG: dihydropyrimidinase [bacterium]|nr:dihydropyrimidinase [bacterium]
MNMLIKGGTIVTASDTYEADIRVDRETISTIGIDLPDDGAQVVDATGKYVFPGFIDAHTHIELPIPPADSGVTLGNYLDDTIAAAHGGTTSIVDFAFQMPGRGLRASLEDWRQRAESKAVVDYGFHLAVTDATEAALKEVPELVAAGVSSFKLFMAYKGLFMSDDTALLNFLSAAKEHGAMVSVHAENGDIVETCTHHVLEKTKDPIGVALSRPPECEDEATYRAIQIAKIADSPLYIVHLSSVGALDAAMRARHAGQPVFVETCPQYLYFDMHDLERPGFEGAKFVCAPPLRPAEYKDVLWNAVVHGGVDVVATDHVSSRFSRRKETEGEGFHRILNGVSGVQERGVLMYDGGVVQRGMSLNRYVQLLSTNPARLFGLYPKKGTIAPGSDADLVIFDPARKTTLSIENIHYDSDHTPYEGMEVNGRVESVIIRGNLVVDRGKFVAKAGSGRFLERRTPHRRI